MNLNKGSHHDWAGLEPPERFRYPALTVMVTAETACFTRAEFPSERVSYQVPTPSALAGALSSVFWKPQFRWVVESVDVLNPIRWVSQQRNELKHVQSLQRPTRKGRWAGEAYDVEAADMRAQRQTLMLRDVAYRIRANVWVHPDAEEKDPAKWRDQFNRRVARGAYFRPPYLGMRENVADFRPDEPQRRPIRESEDLGLMLHSIHADPVTGAETFTWFHGRLQDGTVRYPACGMNMVDALTQKGVKP